MNTTVGLIVTCSVTFIIAIATYLIQYYSDISPCNIEFDARRRFEMNIMYRYNELFDRIFFGAIMIMMSALIFVMVMESATLMIVCCVLEVIYFILNIIAMSVMYLRSRLYWDIQEKKRKAVTFID